MLTYIAPAALVMAGIVHLLPLTGVLGEAQLRRLYGLPIDQPDLAILMRHRAVLFGLLGGFLIYAARREELRAMAFVAAVVSVGSFIALAWTVGGYNAAIARVVMVDWIVLGALGAGIAAHVASGR